MKVMPGMQEHPTKQATIMLLGSYLAYAVCELIGCPGVLAVFFCGELVVRNRLIRKANTQDKCFGTPPPFTLATRRTDWLTLDVGVGQV